MAAASFLLLALLALAPSASAAPCPNEALREQQHSTFLPDCRAYEMVSPPDKNGGDVMANSARTRVAEDGSAVEFASLAGFGDVIGGGAAVEYIAERSGAAEPGGNGWATHAITPPQDPLTFAGVAVSGGLEALYEGDLSPDLSRGVFRAWSLLSDAPNVSNVENLYLRTDLRTPGAGSYQLLSDAVAPVGSSTNPGLNIGKPAFAGASSDFGHVLFQSSYSLTAEATGGGPWLYESDHGTPRVAGVLPDGEALSGALAGQGATFPQNFYTPHVISSDGLRVFFTDPSTGVIGNDGTLYMRETDPVTSARTTVQLNASERTEPDPGGPQPATYWDASADGSRVFFTTTEALTDNAPVNGDRKLYMYDTTKPATDPHNLTLLSVDNHLADSADVQGTLGVSDDGHYVYFTAVGQLVASGPDLIGLHGIYLWHDGTVSYVGELANGDDLTYDVNNVWSLKATEPRVTPDGRHLLFMASSGVGLTGYDHGSCLNNGLVDGQCRELYVYSADNGQLSCASCDPSGAPATSDAVVQVRAVTGSSVTTWARNRAVSDDGRRVFFTTGEALVPQDTNGRLDAYEYDTADGSVHLLSSGKDPSDSYFLNASPSGNDVFILTRQRLLGWDTDAAYDLYDVRVGGGFPEPPSVPPICEGDTCHGTAPLAPSFTPPASSSAGSSGNLVPPPLLSPPPSRHLTDAQKLTKALKACRRKPNRHRRAVCERQARRLYAAHKTSNRGRPR